MKQRILLIMLGCIAAGAVFFTFRDRNKGVGVVWSTPSVNLPKKEPHVYLMWEAPPDVETKARMKNATRLSVRKGEAFSGDKLIAKDEIRAHLDRLVQFEAIEYVIVFPDESTRWGELIAIIDECRRSRVRIVYINQYVTS